MFNLKRLLEKLSPFRDVSSSTQLKSALARSRRRIGRIGTIIDVGASNGSWSLLAKKYFPEAACFMVEAQDGHKSALQRLKSADSSYDYIIAAAGNRDGESFFQTGDLFGGVALYDAVPGNCVTVPMLTLDTALKNKGAAVPYLLKLDTHGFEVPILEGARGCLTDVELLVVEVYNFKLMPESLRFHEIITYLEERGFRCVDICDPLFRKDGVLWQMDLFFMRQDAKCFDSSSYL